jgi:hypothetical protein
MQHLTESLGDLPVGVKDNDLVGGSQVEAHASSTG